MSATTKAYVPLAQLWPEGLSGWSVRRLLAELAALSGRWAMLEADGAPLLDDATSEALSKDTEALFAEIEQRLHTGGHPCPSGREGARADALGAGGPAGVPRDRGLPVSAADVSEVEGTVPTMTMTTAENFRTHYNCPDWCTTDEYGHSIDDPGQPLHIGSICGIEVSQTGAGEVLAGFNGRTDELDAAGLRSFAADCLAAADWLEAHQ